LSALCYKNKLCGSRHNMPRPSPPSVGAEAPRAAEPTAKKRSSRFPRLIRFSHAHRCSCLPR